MTSDITALIDYYVNLLIIQYHDLPNAKSEIRAFVEQALANGIAFDVRDAYSVDTAIGKQLDVLGKYEDINRFYEGENLNGYFAFTNYNDPTPDSRKRGYEDYADFPNDEGQWLTYSSSLNGTFVLSDDDFRTLLRLRIGQNNINHSQAEIDALIFKIFGDSVRADSPGDMVMYYFAPSTLSIILQVAIQKAVLPKPLAVRLNWIILGDTPFFGFATYSLTPTLSTGFTDYADYDTKVGEMLAYQNLVH